MLPELRGMERETFHALLLDTKHRLLSRTRVSEGTLTSSLVHPREVFRPAIRLGAAAVVAATAGRGPCGLGAGTLRIWSATSGFGKWAATSCSTSTRDLPAAARSICSWFSRVRCGINTMSPLRWSSPASSP